MKFKELYILAIFIVSLSIFFLVSHPSYTSYVIDDCSLIAQCLDYTTEDDCIEDECELEDCEWDGSSCISCTTFTDCSTYTYENQCEADPCILDCEWDSPDCIEPVECSDYTDETSCLDDYNCEWDSENEECSEIQEVYEAFTTDDPEIQEILDALSPDVSATVSLLTITDKVVGLPATPVEDITPEMLIQDLDESLIDQIYLIQDQLDARTDIKIFTILTTLDEEVYGTYITKTISAPIEDGYIVEIIPETIAISEEAIQFVGEYEVINYEPLMLSIPAPSGMAIYSYILYEDVLESIDQVQTAIIPYEIEIESAIQVTCGDDICTEILEDEVTCPEDCARKIPWGLITIILVILIIVILVIHFLRHRLKGIKLPFKKEKLFASNIDRQNLQNYIKESLKEGLKSQHIKTVLLAKGWTEKQINYVMNEIKQESAVKPAPSKEPSKSL